MQCISQISKMKTTLKIILILITVMIYSASIRSEEITFKNVTVRGYLNLNLQFEKKLTSNGNIREGIPEDIFFDMLRIVNQDIPVLYSDSITNLDDLEYLALANDSITDIQPGAFKNLNSLKQLVLYDNKLQEIKENVFNGLAITFLDLSDNQLRTINSNAFDNMPFLKSIKLSSNNIAEWDSSWFKGTPLLRDIKMDYNLIQEMPRGSFKNLANNGALTLYFSQNKIKSVNPNVFEHVTEIDVISFANNYIDNIEEGFLKGIETNVLDLENNVIECVQGNYEKIISAKYTKVKGNPWNCTCLHDIVEWAELGDKQTKIVFNRRQC